MSSILETCGNCGRTIGKLETPYLWQENTVCKACYALLSSPEPAAVPVGVAEPVVPTVRTPAVPPQSPPRSAISELAPARYAPSTPRPQRLSADGFICPNPHCGYRGEPERKSRGSILVALVLLLLAVLPGLIYVIMTSGYDYFCPNCGMKLRSEHR